MYYQNKKMKITAAAFVLCGGGRSNRVDRSGIAAEKREYHAVKATKSRIVEDVTSSAVFAYTENLRHSESNESSVWVSAGRIQTAVNCDDFMRRLPVSGIGARDRELSNVFNHSKTALRFHFFMVSLSTLLVEMKGLLISLYTGVQQYKIEGMLPEDTYCVDISRHVGKQEAAAAGRMPESFLARFFRNVRQVNRVGTVVSFYWNNCSIDNNYRTVILKSNKGQAKPGRKPMKNLLLRPNLLRGKDTAYSGCRRVAKANCGITYKLLNNSTIRSGHGKCCAKHGSVPQ